MNLAQLSNEDIWNGYARNKFKGTNKKYEQEIGGFKNWYIEDKWDEGLENIPGLDSKDRILKELNRYEPAANQFKDKEYEYLVLKFGILLTLVKYPNYELEFSRLREKVREWENEIIKKGKNGFYQDDLLLDLAGAAADFPEGQEKIYKTELNLIEHYFDVFNEREKEKNGGLLSKGYLSWIDFFDRMAFKKKFPRLTKNEAHPPNTIEEAFKGLQRQAILFQIKNDSGQEIIGIPEEFVPPIKQWLFIELTSENFSKLIKKIPDFNSQEALLKVQKEFGLPREGQKLEDRRQIISESKVFPSEALEVALSKEQLKQVVDRFRVDIPKFKNSKILSKAIVDSFDHWGREKEENGWKNPEFLEYFEKFASITVEDLPPFIEELEGDKRDVENKLPDLFELATAEIFEHVFNLKSTKLRGHKESGSNVPDGEIDLGNSWIIWDNKACNGKYNLNNDQKLHLDDYITSYKKRSDKKKVDILMIISNGFTKKTIEKVENLNLDSDRDSKYLLITSPQFKKLAEAWLEKFPHQHAKKEFPVGVFTEQRGQFKLEPVLKKIEGY